MRTDVITLIQEGFVVDAYGDTHREETMRDVFAEVMSIGQKEFYQAQAVGLQPEIKFKLADYLEYHSEPALEYNGVRYKVLRTYRNDQELELTCYREVNPHERA